ncbi:MAG: hypothetical protein JW932_05915 [Deltaproteobacteria bacterium]|nr:hypothetical protein [Deltaproteobacteria bacterium]
MNHEIINGEKALSFLLSIFVSILILCPPYAWAKREHVIHFPNTVYELNIYKIHGKKPGKTLMLIGGIQGNEPGGFLSADLYADMSLETGNLIVVPRANFYSIILNHRGPHGDMNRKFTHEDSSQSMEDKIVTILKGLISESDYLLNLHDGSGYYHPTYINNWRNPLRFGQSIIADCSEYRIPGSDEVIALGAMAQDVIDEVNVHIKNELHQFRFMNTQTDNDQSSHKEQRKSATYYALTVHHIPAFGIETSKFLPSIDLKVWYHNLIINAFMKRFHIIPESPNLTLDPPELRYLIVSINGNIPIVINKEDNLYIRKGDAIHVSHIESNYERGLSLDILGYGNLNDYRKTFTIFRDTSMIVRKDNHTFVEIPIKVADKGVDDEVASRLATRKIEYLRVETNGYQVLIANGETLDLVMGDKMKILDVFPPRPESIIVNFKGFVGNITNNTGEDRGYTIDTATALLKRYSLNNKGILYEIVVSDDDKTLAKFNVRLTPPKLDYLVFKVNDDRHILLRSDDKVSLSPKDKIYLEEIRTTLYNGDGVHLRVNGHQVKQGESRVIRDLGIDQHNQIDIRKDSLILGKVFIQASEK